MTVNTNAVFTGTFVNAGVYDSDPSNNYFNNLIIETTGYLHGGGRGQLLYRRQLL